MTATPVSHERPQEQHEIKSIVIRSENIPMLHSCPVQPISQIQVNDPGVLIQVPPFSHCKVLHSLTSNAQFGPVHPSVHVHVYEPSVFKHVPPF